MYQYVCAFVRICAMCIDRKIMVVVFKEKEIQWLYLLQSNNKRIEKEA